MRSCGRSYKPLLHSRHQKPASFMLAAGRQGPVGRLDGHVRYYPILSGGHDPLRRRFDAVERRAGVETQLEMEESLDLPAMLEEQLYRIAQEALNNSLKHSAATAVTVSITVDGDKVRMFVGDKGRGFDLQAAESSGGMELNNIQERVQNLEGTAEIDSSIGTGTRILISIPIRPSQPEVHTYPYTEAAE